MDEGNTVSFPIIHEIKGSEILEISHLTRPLFKVPGTFTSFELIWKNKGSSSNMKSIMNLKNSKHLGLAWQMPFHTHTAGVWRRHVQPKSHNYRSYSAQALIHIDYPKILGESDVQPSITRKKKEIPNSPRR